MDLPLAVTDAASCKVVGGYFHRYFITGEDPDVVCAHFSADICANGVSVFEFDIELCSGQQFFYNTLKGYAVF